MVRKIFVVGLSQSVTNLGSDFATQRVVSKSLVQVVDEGAGNQQVVHDDGLLCHRRITGAQDRSTRSVVRQRPSDP